jgi:hypothetical protein
LSRKGKNIYKRKDRRWERRYIKLRINPKVRYRYVYGKTVSDVLSVVKSMLKYAFRSKYKINTSAFDVSVSLKYKSIRVLSIHGQTKLINCLTSNISDVNIGIMFSMLKKMTQGQSFNP